MPRPRHPFVMLAWRIVLVYVTLALCRTVFYFYNATALGTPVHTDWGSLLVGALKFDTVSVIYANGLFILLSLVPLHLREKGVYRNLLFGIYLFFNSVLIVGLNLADAVYFSYTQKRITADELFFAENDNTLPLIGKFMFENLGIVVVGVALVLGLALGYRRRTPVSPSPRNPWIYYLGGLCLLALTGGLCVAGVRGGFTRMTRPITLSNAALYTSDNAQANLILSNPFCLLRTVGSSSGNRVPHYFDDAEALRLFNPTHQPVDSAAVDLSGRNVVIFIMESMSADHSFHLMPEAYADRPIKGFTPFLDSLMRNGYCFRQMYANGTRSIQAMPSVLGSMPSFKTPFVLMPQSLGASRQLPAILRDMGYTTAFFCGSDRGSMGFDAYARSAGIDRLFSRQDYETAHGNDDFDGYWGIWDEPFLQYAGEEFGALPEPFFATLFTISSHHPFYVPETYADSLPEGYTRIHKSVPYDDQAFRPSFQRSHTTDWFQRTLFVFVADHVSSEKFAPESRLYPGNYHIIGFLYTPDGTLQGESNDVVQQLDIMPTVLGLVGGASTSPYFAFGRDLFNEPERPSWSLSYDDRFHALLQDRILHFDEETLTTTRRDDGTPLVADTLGDRFKALIQQYYKHIAAQNYLPE